MPAGYSILALVLGPRHVFVRLAHWYSLPTLAPACMRPLARWQSPRTFFEAMSATAAISRGRIERVFGRRADRAFCVTDAMRRDLVGWGIE